MQERLQGMGRKISGSGEAEVSWRLRVLHERFCCQMRH